MDLFVDCILFFSSLQVLGWWDFNSFALFFGAWEFRFFGVCFGANRYWHFGMFLYHFTYTVYLFHKNIIANIYLRAGKLTINLKHPILIPNRWHQRIYLLWLPWMMFLYDQNVSFLSIIDQIIKYSKYI